MNFLLLNFLLISSTLFSQSFEKFEKNENLKKYKSVEIIGFYNKHKKTSWSKKIYLKNGNIKSIQYYNKSRLTYHAEYYYDDMNNLDFEITKFERFTFLKN